MNELLPLPAPRTALDRRIIALFNRVAPYDDVADIEYGAYGEDDPRGYAEMLVHEIAHCVVLRRGVKTAVRRPIDDFVGGAVPNFPEVRLHRSDPILVDAEHERAVQEANEHEIATIAVEVIASETFGLPFDPMDIAVFAVDGENVRGMTYAECCERIERAMELRTIKRWGRDLGRFLLEPT